MKYDVMPAERLTGLLAFKYSPISTVKHSIHITLGLIIFWFPSSMFFLKINLVTLSSATSVFYFPPVPEEFETRPARNGLGQLRRPKFLVDLMVFVGSSLNPHYFPL